MVRNHKLFWFFFSVGFIILGFCTPLYSAVHHPFVNPVVIKQATSTTVTISAYIPDQNLIANSINLLRLAPTTGKVIATLGTLNDNGINGDLVASDKVFSIQVNFNEQNPGQIKLQVSAALKGVLKRILSEVFTINVLNISAVNDFTTSYNSGVMSSFNSGVSLVNDFKSLNDSISTDQLIAVITQITLDSTSILFNLEAVRDFELSHTPQIIKDFFLGLIPGLDTMVNIGQNGGKAIDQTKAFIQDGTDPQVSNIVEYYRENPDKLAVCGLTLGDLDSILPSSDSLDQDFRACLARHYQFIAPSGFAKVASTEAVKFEIGQALSPAEDGLGQLIANRADFSPLGELVVTRSIGSGNAIIIDHFIDKNGQQNLMLKEVATGEIFRIPTGTHNMLYSFGNDVERSVFANIPISSTSTFALSVYPGDIIDYGAGAWPMFGHDAQHTGQSQYVGPKTPNLRWVFEFKEGTVTGRGGSPVIDGEGNIYIPARYAGGGDIGFLYAINSDGTLKWKGNSDVTGAISAAIGLDGTIYVARNLWWDPYNYLWAFDRLSGQYKWSLPLASGAAPPVVSLDGRIYFVDLAGLHAINPDGSVKWNEALPPSSLALDPSPSISHNESIIAGASWYTSVGGLYSYYSTLYSINRETGQTNWKVNFPLISYCPVVDKDDTIYISSAGDLYSVSPLGQINWQKDFSPLMVKNVAIGKNGTIYLWAADNQGVGGALYALNTSGEEKWIHATGWSALGTPAIGDDDVIYFGANGKVFALQPDGSLLWEYYTGGGDHYLAIGADGTLYVSVAAYLYAFKD